MSGANKPELFLVKKTEDGEYVAHKLNEPGTFVAVPDSESAWKPFTTSKKKAEE